MHQAILHFDIDLLMMGFVTGVYAMCVVWALNGGDDDF